MSGTKKKDEFDFQKYLVGLDPSGHHVIILNDQGDADDDAVDGHKIIGKFEADAVNRQIKGVSEEDFDPKGDHVFVYAAKRILTDELGVEDFKGYTFEDKASNAPTGNSYVLTHDEREQAVREGKSPADVQQEMSDSLEAAEKKAAKDAPKKK